MVNQVFSKIIPISLLLCCVALGVNILMGNIQGASFLEHITTNTGSYYSFNWQGYISQLSINYFEDLTKFFTDVPSWNYQDYGAEIYKYIMQTGVNLVNSFIYVINLIVVMPLNIVGIILKYVLSILGLNLSNSNGFWLADLMNFITSMNIQYLANV